MIDIKDATKTAVEFLVDIYGTEHVIQPMLEEVEKSQGEWWLTISYLSQPAATSARDLYSSLGIHGHERQYKVIRVSEQGEIAGMKMRKVD